MGIFEKSDSLSTNLFYEFSKAWKTEQALIEFIPVADTFDFEWDQQQARELSVETEDNRSTLFSIKRTNTWPLFSSHPSNWRSCGFSHVFD